MAQQTNGCYGLNISVFVLCKLWPKEVAVFGQSPACKGQNPACGRGSSLCGHGNRGLGPTVDPHRV